MIFCIITHVVHGKDNDLFYSYSPYVREMNIWLTHVDNTILVAPLNLNKKSEIEEYYLSKNIDFRRVGSFDFLSFISIVKALFNIPKILLEIYKAMRESDHIHLRCPGNMGLLGCIVQIFFPKKIKTAKYAGNWSPDSKQPFSYKIQKWILNNTFLTKNMTVLVYGEWQNSSKNIKPFFTASYREADRVEVQDKEFDSSIDFIFVGSLTTGKNPLYAIQLVEKLHEKYNNISLSIYGNGIEYESLKNYIELKQLSSFVRLLGNKSQEEIKLAYQKSHFVILPSKSEGWPKVVAEGMFWKCLPIATKVSCVPNMLKEGERGILLKMHLEKDIIQIEELILDKRKYKQKVNDAYDWSRKYTLDYFENEIKKLIIS